MRLEAAGTVDAGLEDERGLLVERMGVASRNRRPKREGGVGIRFCGARRRDVRAQAGNLCARARRACRNRRRSGRRGIGLTQVIRPIVAPICDFHENPTGPTSLLRPMMHDLPGSGFMDVAAKSLGRTLGLAALGIVMLTATAAGADPSAARLIFDPGALDRSQLGPDRHPAPPTPPTPPHTPPPPS